MIEFPHELVEALSERHVIPLIGAGLSIGAGYPSWNELCESLKAQLSDEQKKFVDDDNFVIAELFSSRFGRTRLYEILKNTFFVESKSYTECHRLLSRFGFTDVITTNWDDLLEHCFRDAGQKVNPVLKLDDWRLRAGKDEVIITHIHGHASAPDTITLTQKDFLGPNPLLDKALGQIERSTLLMLGLSLKDARVQGLRYGENRNAFAIMFDCTDAETAYLRGSFGINVINIETAGRNKTEMLAEALEKLLQEATRQGLPDRRMSAPGPAKQPQEFEQVLVEMLHSTSIQSRNLIVQNGMNFYRYSIFFTDLINKLQHYDNMKLQIYNIYQPHDFLLDLLNSSKEVFQTFVPEEKLNKLFVNDVVGSRKEYRYQHSTEILESLLDHAGGFVSEAVKETIKERCRLAFPSLNIINEFAEKNPGRFTRITILFKEYEGLLTKKLLQFFNSIMKTSSSHYVVEDDTYRSIIKEPVHISDFCIWSNERLDVVSDYYPSSSTLILGWHYNTRAEDDLTVKRFVDYYTGLYRNMLMFGGKPIEEYIDHFQQSAAKVTNAGAV